jgi:hypothetical protein
MEEKRQQRTVGSIVKIPLERGYHSYARILKSPYFAFYDFREEEVSNLDLIVSSPILFITSVSHYSVTSGLWVKVGKLPLEKNLLKIPPQFIQDSIQTNQFEIVYYDGRKKKATAEECAGLERLAVWTPESIQERLIDHYAGRQNFWVKPTKKLKIDMDKPSTIKSIRLVASA